MQPAEETFHPHLRVEFDGEVAVVTLDSPQRRNAQTPSMWAALERIAEVVEQTPQVRVVLLRAEGPSFSAGLDRGMLAPGGMEGEVDLLAACAASPTSGMAPVETCQRGFARLRAVPAVIVAAVQGHAVGAGAELAMCADLRVVADDLALSWPEVPLGIAVDLGGIGRLTPVVGEARAIEILLTGRVVDADEALRVGLANRVVARAELDAAAQSVVDGLLALPADAMREMLLLIRGAGQRSEPDQLKLEAAAQARLLHNLTRANHP